MLADAPKPLHLAFSPPAEIVTLDRNYRSTRPILAAANAVVDLASERFTKNSWTDRTSEERPHLVTVTDEAEQARYVAERLLENREAGSALKQQAMLFRTSHHSGPLEIELARRNIPFVKFGGLKFLDAAHVKDMLALLRSSRMRGISGSSPLLNGYDEPEILLSSTRGVCLKGADAGQGPRQRD